MRSELYRFFRGFVYAFRGLRLALRTERNFRFHLCAAGAVIWFAARFYPWFGGAEWAVLLLCCGCVPAFELVNSAVERAVDCPDTAHWKAAGQAKDLAAAAVLVSAVGSTAVGAALFWRVDSLLVALGWLLVPGHFAAVLAFAALGVWFVFCFGEKK